MADIINKLNVGHIVNVKLTNNAAINGKNLVDAYNYAKTLNPNNQALSSTNRVSIIIQPGNYQLPFELLVDTQFIDIIGLGAQKLDQGCIPAVNITFGNTINVTANDVRIQGINVGVNQSFKIGDNLPSQIFENCRGGSGSFRSSTVTAGTFINCFCQGTNGFGGLSTASGTFINCLSGGNAFGSISSGVFINCSAASFSFGSNGTASGTFTNCSASSGSFGGGFTGAMLASGIFINCFGGGGSFGGTISGKLYQCRVETGYPFQGVVGSGGVMRNCIDGYNDIIDAQG